MVELGAEAAIATGVTTAVLGLLLALRKPHARSLLGTDDRLLIYGRGLKIFAAFTLGFVAFLTMASLWGYFLTPDSSGWTPTRLVLVDGTFWFIAAVLLVEVYGTWYRFSPTLFTRHSLWKGTLTVHWEDIQTVRFNAALNWFVFRTLRGAIRMQPYLDGFPEFMRMAEARIHAEAFGKPMRPTPSP